MLDVMRINDKYNLNQPDADLLSRKCPEVLIRSIMRPPAYECTASAAASSGMPLVTRYCTARGSGMSPTSNTEERDHSDWAVEENNQRKQRQVETVG